MTNKIDKRKAVFEKYFQKFKIKLPKYSSKKKGMIKSHGWIIKYISGKNKKGEYLEFYATHRMTNDRHLRIYTNGKTEDLPAIQTASFEGTTKSETEKARKELINYNKKVIKELQSKKLFIPTINAYLSIKSK